MWRLDAEEEENDICVPKIVEKRRNCDCQQLIGNPHCNSQSNNRPNTRCESDTYCDFQINRQSIADRIPIIEDTGRVKINGMVWISRRIARQCNDIPDNCMENKRTHRCNRSTDHRSTCFNCNILCDRASQCSPLHDSSSTWLVECASAAQNGSNNMNPPKKMPPIESCNALSRYSSHSSTLPIQYAAE